MLSSQKIQLLPSQETFLWEIPQNSDASDQGGGPPGVLAQKVQKKSSKNAILQKLWYFNHDPTWRKDATH